jgi:hypothetical protein
VATIPIWLLGRHTTLVTARWQTPDANGLLGNGTSSTQTITGLVDSVEYNGQNTTETINCLISFRENEVVTEHNDTFVLTEVMRDGIAGTSTNVLASLWMNADSADVCLITLTRGGNSYAAYMCMQDYSESIRKGKCVARMTLTQVDIDPSVSNPSYT